VVPKIGRCAWLFPAVFELQGCKNYITHKIPGLRYRRYFRHASTTRFRRCLFAAMKEEEPGSAMKYFNPISFSPPLQLVSCYGCL